MKHYFIFLAVLFFSACHAQQPQIHQKEIILPDLTLSAKLLRTFYNSYEKPVKYTRLLDAIRDKQFEVELTLKNNTDSVISFWMMSCSYKVQNVMLSNDDFSVIHYGCDKNIPVIKKLSPNDSFVFNILLLRNLPPDSLINDSLWTNRYKQKTSICFIAYDTSNISRRVGRPGGDELFFKEGDMVWSNELTLEAGY